MANVRATAAVASSLVSKGMVADESHHHMYRLQIEGVDTLVTRVSHGSKEVDDYLLSLMGRQCGLKLREFLDLVDCPMDADTWIQIVTERFAGGRNPLLGR